MPLAQIVKLQSNSVDSSTVTLPPQVLTEKLGTPDKATTHKLVQARQSDPDACASPVCDWYDAKLQRLALLEFDRDRKSMGVIARQTPYTRHSGMSLLQMC
jgi:hypothetical protein